MSQGNESTGKIWSALKSNWLSVSAWGAGSAIFGWLLAGLIYQRDYRNLTTGDLLCAILATVVGVVIALVSLWLIKRGHKKSAESSTDTNTPETLSEIIAGVLPAIFFILSLATLVLTFSTYNGDWKDARQGLATGFAALIAAVGAIISVNVTYKISEENRKAQKNIEENRDKREQDKQDAETIKSLNDRLHNIIPRRNSSDEKERISSYFQLAALYNDWDLLTENSEKIDKQRANQQKYILKILFGTAKKDADSNFIKVRTTEEDIALNSIISDLFAHEEENDDVEERYLCEKEDDALSGYYLEYADLSYLDFSKKILDNSNFSNAFLEGSTFYKSRFRNVNFQRASLVGVNFYESYLENVNFWHAVLEKVDFRVATLQSVNFIKAILDGTNFSSANLGNIDFRMASLEEVNFSETSFERVNFMYSSLKGVEFYGSFLGDCVFSFAKIFSEGEYENIVLEKLSQAESLPDDEQLLKIQGFTKSMLSELKNLHEAVEKERYGR